MSILLSLLGPLLILIYFNDFRYAISSGHVQDFADDQAILLNHRFCRKMKTAVAKDISTLCEWLCSNRLSLNTEESELIAFAPKSKVSLMLVVKIKNKKLCASNKVKYLGTITDSKLSWQSHISNLALRSIYYSLSHSHMTWMLMFVIAKV